MSAGLNTLLKRNRTFFVKYKRTIVRLYSKTQENAATKSYSDTVLLPQTSFPMRINVDKRNELDNYLIEKCGFHDLYNWQRTNLSGSEFVLHDGPPYANGDLHMGHAINKILKDITLRNKVINRHKVHYVPGWDCHGLPIELKALTASKTKDDLTPLQIRELAKKFAHDTMVKQREMFASWGIMADWKDSGCYLTNNKSYITNQLKQFIELYEKNLIYRDFKPVHWSPASKTALAEAELEYRDHESTCVTVRLKVVQLPPVLSQFKDKRIYALTWTTTPWTLIANQALAYSSSSEYCLVENSKGDCYILAQELLESNKGKIGEFKVLITFPGSELAGTNYLQPMTGVSLQFLPAKHVNTTQGTGLVHTAPAHGSEDFLVALEHKIPVISLVDENGRYTSEAGEQLKGLEVFTQGQEAILKYLESEIVCTEKIVHSYPYDWRTKKPVLTRASHQWFIDTNTIKERAIEALKNVTIFPAQNELSGKKALHNQIMLRPYWCISRQRVWGTPIPVLFHKETKQVITNREWVERLCGYIEKYNPDCWWTMPIEKLAGKKLLKDLNLDSSEIERGQDILDIWFDSGISWSAVLPDKSADLYLEGMDQFTGWFQSSLLTSIALQNKSPYKSLFVHGFAVDKNNNKMSKSLGNVVHPEEITKGGKNLKKQPAFGVDVLRWWVAHHGCQHTLVPVKEELLRGSADSIQKIRSILRFLLGALYPYDEEIEVQPEYLHLDLYMLHQLHEFNRKVNSLYDSYEYHNVTKEVLNFVTNDVSAVYCHTVKDRLYCEKVNSPFRVAATDVMNSTLTVLVRSIAPILPFLAEEVWLYYPQNLASVPLFHIEYKIPDDWNKPEIASIIKTALDVKSDMNKLINKNTWMHLVEIDANPKLYSTLKLLHPVKESSTSELCEILQVAGVQLNEDPSCQTVKISLKNTEKSVCKRCRRYPEDGQGELCSRCKQICSTL